jgi:hypothetical protein
MKIEAGCTLELIGYSSRCSFNTPEGLASMVRSLDSKIWAHLLHESGLLSFLDAKSREEWRKAIEHDDVPEVTQKNIEATFAALYSARGDMFERGVCELFRNLSWDYKRNSPVKLGRKLVLRHIVDMRMGKWEWASPEIAGCDKLDDLVRVMSMLDNKPEPDHRHATYQQLNEAQFPRTGDVDLGYLVVRGFKNGNGHIVLVRQDLVDSMNRIIARHHPTALPPTRE